MGLFDNSFDFDPAQFAVGGGLLGRLEAMQPFNQFLPGDGFPSPPVSPNTPAAVAVSGGPTGPAPQKPVQSPLLTPDYGQIAPMPIGDYLMPRFGRAEQPALAPDFATRLSAGFQSWAHTPVGNPFAGLANGIAGFNSGRRVVDPGAKAADDGPETLSPAQPLIPSTRILPQPADPRRRFRHGR
ncbi:hypothetical protein JQ604_30900 [Bradyrhizobium jicamae]|uniref:hypothetical protein n=1 Tax=Bradyrhizobium jicamae TaxID=280332 RepID=UPI001BAB425E|nr:hypothetical protein [Bradyrhizobium jicamae]MBR0756608.1 hypothetical protein [Bradyrhizobium jicamae]